VERRVLPPAERQNMVDKTIDAGLSGSDVKLKAGLKGIVNELIARKHAYFASTRRISTSN
jgi:hypothetical protein